ncbi:MAG: CrcB family protein [Planctomycetes bacterium]|nr:CrcB family protein [Planctomycetota bacterium]MCL4728989.1 CrcB family protein [Planctomycetota bacterium]
MKFVLLVCLGGAVGSGLRYGTDRALLHWLPEPSRAFPWATLAVNLAGCLAAGLLYGWLSREGVRYADDLKLLLITGLCGGLTTFSTFALQSLQVSPGKAIANVALSVAGGLALAWLGLWLTRA